MSGKVKWSAYEFDVCKHNDNWRDVGGIYIFTGLTAEKKWRPFYIGQTDNFQKRIPNHERWDEAVRLGATHVHARTVSAAATRDAIEAELIQAFRPHLNEKLK